MKPLIAIFFAAVLTAVEPGAKDANEMLRRVDEYRNPLPHYSVDVDLTLLHRDETRGFTFRVYGKGDEASLLQFRAPATDKGKFYVMLKDDRSIYLPDASRPIRISPLQRLVGEASNGDVARTTYGGDYDAEIGGEEAVDGKPAILLLLKGKDADMSYSKVKLWVAAGSIEPIKAEYYAMSGRMLKKLYFREFGMLGARRIVKTIEIQDAIRPDHRTMMSYSNLISKQYPDKMFNRNYMGKW